MPLFLVRWGTGLRASLVSARDTDDLIDILDQEDDPGSYTYRGPVWIDFRPPFEVRDITPEPRRRYTPRLIVPPRTPRRGTLAPVATSARSA